MAGWLHDLCHTEFSSGGKCFPLQVPEIVKIFNKGAVGGATSWKLEVNFVSVSDTRSENTMGATRVQSSTLCRSNKTN